MFNSYEVSLTPETRSSPAPRPTVRHTPKQDLKAKLPRTQKL